MNSRKGEKLVSKETIFDEKIEGYKKCGSTDKKFDCKKDCLISHNAVLSYINQNLKKQIRRIKMKEVNKVTVKSERVKWFDEKIEG